MSTNKQLCRLRDITTLQRHRRRRYWTKEPQCHPYHELIYVLWGRFELRSQSEKVGSMHMAYVPAGLRHQTRFLPSGRSGEGSAAILLQWQGPPLEVPSSMPDTTGRIRRILEWMMDLYAGSMEDRNAARQLLEPFLCEVRRNVMKENSLLPMIDVFIEEHLEDHFTASELAAACGLSRAHFSRMFKQSQGIPPMQYVMQYRLKEVEKRLSNPHLTLADIARNTGFCSSSHLIKVYKREKGMTPRKKI